MEDEVNKPRTLEEFHQREDSSSAWETKDKKVEEPRRGTISRAADTVLSILGDEKATQRQHLDDKVEKGHISPEEAKRAEKKPAETSPGSNMISGTPPPPIK